MTKESFANQKRNNIEAKKLGKAQQQQQQLKFMAKEWVLWCRCRSIIMGFIGTLSVDIQSLFDSIIFWYSNFEWLFIGALQAQCDQMLE